jgi:hypothetical protein
MSDRLATRLGFWAATVTAVLGLVYLLLLGGYFATQGFVFPPTPFVQLMGGIITFATAPALLVLFAAIKHLAPQEKGILGTLGLCFTVLFVAMVSINRFVQLTVIRLSPSGPASQDLARFLPYSTGSVMFALEILGWGFFLSLAALFVAPLFTGGRLQNAIRWLWIVFAIISFLSVIGFATDTPVIAGAFIAWGPVLLALAVLLMVLFKRGGPLSAGLRDDHHSVTSKTDLPSS